MAPRSRSGSGLRLRIEDVSSSPSLSPGGAHMPQLWPAVAPHCAQWKALSVSCARLPAWSDTAQGCISPLAVQSLSRVQLFATPRTVALQASLSFTISQSLLKLMSTESVMPSNHLILCCPLLLPSIFPRIRNFSNESALPISGQSIGASASASVLSMNIQG